jgi:hypothetical protein
MSFHSTQLIGFTMTDALINRIHRKIWSLAFGHEWWIRKNGDFRTKERYGQIYRPNYAYGMLRAADNAKYYGYNSVSIMEFGVASGGGILNMIECASYIAQETGVIFKIFGFDTGSGLPVVDGFKDHPEIWNPGDFFMENRDDLNNKIEGKANIIWGDIAKTVDSFMSSLDESSPIGFISIDVDLYSSTVSALRCLNSRAEKYLPAVSMYFDDVSFFTANPWCGELAAINEFNQDSVYRKISNDRSLPGRRPLAAQSWYSSMYVCHILDHDARQRPRSRGELSIQEHHELMSRGNLY